MRNGTFQPVILQVTHFPHESKTCFYTKEYKMIFYVLKVRDEETFPNLSDSQKGSS